MATHELAISGMDCPDCARTLERGVARLPGVQTCALDFQTEQMRVTYAAEQVDQAAIIARIRALGYDIKPSAPANASDAASAPQAGRLRGALAFGAFLLARRASGVPLLVGGALLLVGALLGWLGAPPQLGAGVELLALLVASVPIVRGALQALLLTRRVTIQLLMTLAALGALILGAYAEAATVMVLFALGETLEGFTMQRARDSLRGLAQLAPAEALVLVPCDDCAEHRGRAGYVDGPCPWCAPHPLRRPVAQVAVGQIVLVQPGERVPLDGLITSGASLVSQQHITGESMPVARGVGEQVYAGSINGDGALELRVSAPAQESLLSRIAALVTQAQSERAPIEQIMERFAAVYTPIVIVLAVLVAALPPLLLGQPFWSTAAETGWLYRALTLLVIACPCALVISTPVSSVSALSAAARAGVLVKGGAVLAALRKIRVVAFDKTGTLTMGQPQVTQVRCADDCCATERDCAHCDDVLALAAAVETRSAHPLAGAVLRAAEGRHVAGRYAAADVTALPGRGVRGQLARGTVTIGSHALFDAEHRHTAALCAQISAAEARGQTVLMVCACDGGGVQGYLTVADTLRPEGQQVIRDLRALGVTRTALLTGDTQAAGALVAQTTGVDEARGALLPANKLGAVRELAARYGPVAMVGDGVNDTPALAAATIGIAMGAAGSAQALATADVALLHDDLTRLPFLLRLSQRADTVIRQNIAVSIGAKVLFLALAVGGWATLWAAIAADTGVALLVIANGMRLLRVRP